VRLRHVIGIAILAFWVGVLGFHVRREYFRSEAVVLAHGAQWLGPGTHFYTVEMQGRAIGMASSRLDTIPEGFRFEDLLQLDVPAMGQFHAAVIRTRARLGRALELIDFDFQLQAALGDYRVRGEASGDSILTLRLDAGAGDQVSTMRIGPSTTLPAALPLRLAAAGRLGEGREYTARIMDPSVLADRSVAVRVTGRGMEMVVDSAARDDRRGVWRAASTVEVPVWVVEERYGGVTITSWLDQEGRLVRSESPMGFSIRRTAYELAEQAWRRSRETPELAAGYGLLIESTAIAANVDPGGAGRGLESMTVRLLNVDLAGFDLDGGRQTLRGDTLVIRRERPAALAAEYALPYRGGGAPAEALAPTPLAQSGDPRIAATARRIAGGSASPEEVARRLNDWVYRSVAKEITPSIPSAVQVLESLQGDCNEHTVLYVALARSLGLPTRKAAGVVQVDGRFFYHAWPEVWLGDWVAVDPTLGQFPAAASHVRFLVGGLARQVELVRLIGRLELDIVGVGSS
jgi:transglutaminase-like putative cysteine protease